MASSQIQARTPAVLYTYEPRRVAGNLDEQATAPTPAEAKALILDWLKISSSGDERVATSSASESVASTSKKSESDAQVSQLLMVINTAHLIEEPRDVEGLRKFELSSQLSAKDASNLYHSVSSSVEEKYAKDDIERALGRQLAYREMNDKALDHWTVRQMPHTLTETAHGQWRRYGRSQYRVDTVFGDDAKTLARPSPSCTMHTYAGQKRIVESMIEAAVQDGAAFMLLMNPVHELHRAAECRCKD